VEELKDPLATGSIRCDSLTDNVLVRSRLEILRMSCAVGIQPVGMQVHVNTQQN